MSAVADTDLMELTQGYRRGRACGTQEPLPVGTRYGRYRVLRLLGSGGMGAVYLAEQFEPVRRAVAVKIVLHSQFDRGTRARFDLERQALASLAHAGVAQLYDAGCSEDGTAWFAMEYVDGVCLDQHWQQHPRDLRSRVATLRELCRIVGHAHRRGIVHCDLKPANVMVTLIDGQEQLKVIDFGISHAVGSMGSVVHAGTPAWMAPEQARSGVSIDARADVYALGALLRAALGAPIRSWLAQVPADSAAHFERIAAGIDDDPQAALSELPLPAGRRAELAAILARALAHDPDARYEDAHALADDLDRWLKLRPVHALPQSAIYHWRCALRRHRWGALVAAGMLLLTTGFALQSWRQYRLTLAEHATAEQVVRLLIDTYTAADPVQFPGGSASARDLLAAAAARAQTQPLPPNVHQRILEALGIAQHNLELYADARASYLRALQAVPPSDSVERDRLRLRLARIDSDLGDYAAAEDLARAVGARQRDPALRADSLLLRADNALQQADLDVAAMHIEEVAPLVADSRERQRHLAVVRARIADARGDPQLALRAQRGALALAELDWSNDDLRMLDLRNDAAIYAGKAGRHDEAIAELERIAALTAAAWGSESAGLAIVYGNLGVARLRKDDAVGAETEHRRAAAIFERTLGPESLHTGSEYNNLAVALTAQGRASEAMAWFERAASALSAAVGADHLRVGVTLHNQARACIANGELERARSLLDRSAAILEPALGREHPRWQVWRMTEAEWQLASGEVDAARATLQALQPQIDAAFGVDSREAQRARDALLRAEISP